MPHMYRSTARRARRVRQAAASTRAAGTWCSRAQGGTVNVCSITGAWFENNGSFGLDFDVGVATASITNFDVTRCQFGGGAAGDLSQNALHFQTPGAGSSINRLEIATCKANSLDLVIPSAGVYGCDRNNTLQTFTNNYPTGWLHIDYASACRFQTSRSTRRRSRHRSARTLAPSPPRASSAQRNNTTIVAARNAANNADLRVLSTDNANDLFVGNTTNFAATYVLGPSLPRQRRQPIRDAARGQRGVPLAAHPRR